MAIPERSLRILQVSTSDVAGGAERVAWNLFQAYRAAGHESWLAVGRRYGDAPGVLQIEPPPVRGAWERFFRALSARVAAGESRDLPRHSFGRLLLDISRPGRIISARLGVEDFDYPETGLLLRLPPKPPDLLHAHNLHGGYFDLRQLPVLTTQLPVVLTLHDAWLLSGHCAHSFACERWRIGCGRCPDLASYVPVRRDATAWNWRRKRDILARCRLFVTTPSAWLMKRVEQSILAPAIIDSQVIPNGIDLAIWRPGDRARARTRLGLPLAPTLLLFVANGGRANSFKDFGTLRSAIGAFAGRHTGPLWVLVLGDAGPDEEIAGVHLRCVSAARDPVMVADYYRAADIYLHPARADTFPNAVLEAMACGLPIIASWVGGIPEQVRDPQGGLLIPPGDPQALADAIVGLLSAPARRQAMGRFNADWSTRLSCLGRQVQDTLDWYQQILALERR